jgi:hypothetical protein
MTSKTTEMAQNDAFQTHSSILRGMGDDTGGVANDAIQSPSTLHQTKEMTL